MNYKHLLFGLPILLLAGCSIGQTPESSRYETKFSLPQESSAALPLNGFAGLGYPKDLNDRNLKILENYGYTVGYYEDYSVPLWACYYCDAHPLKDEFKRPTYFATDYRTAARVSHEDFKNPPHVELYERGHMAPNYAMMTRYGKRGQDESFRMSNVVPQRGAINGGIWAGIEEKIAKHYSISSGGCWVTVGPVFNGRVTRFNGKAAVPNAFFCIILSKKSNGAYAHLAYVIPHSIDGGHAPDEFISTIKEIEELTGLNFDSKLNANDEHELESSAADTSYFRALNS